MKGYYVIGFRNTDPIEFTGKNARARAILKANEIHKQGCEEVIIQHFDDNNPDGYMAGEECIIVS